MVKLVDQPVQAPFVCYLSPFGLCPRQMLLKELNLGPHKYEFSSMAVSLALEGKASHRELTSRLLSDLSGKLLSQSDLARAFDKMLNELPDLMLDTPEAPQVDQISKLVFNHSTLPYSISRVEPRSQVCRGNDAVTLFSDFPDVGSVHRQSHCRPHPSNVFPGLL